MFRTIDFRQIKKVAGAVGFAVALTGCITPWAGSDGNYATPIGSAPVTDNETPYSNALRCFGPQVASQRPGGPRVAVGNIRDYTYKEDLEGGRKLTQGAALMAISALAKANVPLVERFDTSVTELELKYANNKLVGDGGDVGFRKIVAGTIRGSDYYLVGGITELNYNIKSNGIDAFGADDPDLNPAGNIGVRLFVLNVGIDLRLVNSQTLEVVDVVSYQKQIIGREFKAGYFDILNGYIFDVSAGQRALEPVQLAIRAVIERAMIEMLVPLYALNPGACNDEYDRGDPLADDGDELPGNEPSAPSTASINVAYNRPAVTRTTEPYSYYGDYDNTSPLRGGYD